jgi:N-carbamoyl-L-amino-acid hydrolase
VKTKGSDNIAALRVDGERLWRSLMDLAEIGAVPGEGSNRVALTDEDAAGQALFAEWAREQGCVVTRDKVGNLFATRPGADQLRRPVMIGSHLDTQPYGGRFDGPVGVLSGLEILRTLDDHGIRTVASIMVASFANEEGARFPQPMTGSGVFAGVLTMEAATAQRALDGPSFGEELERLGLAGAEPVGGSVDAYFELHIEQSTTLQRAGADVGIVECGQAVRALAVTLTGEASHAGTTAMTDRRDALVAASHAVQLAQRAGQERDALVTVGRLEVRPNSRSVVPGEVCLVVDIRDASPEKVDELEGAIREGLAGIEAETAVVVKVERALDIPGVVFDEGCKSLVREACLRLGLAAIPVVSGAAHDAMNMARVAPAGLVFIPCRNGISHNPAEYASPEQVRAGCDALLHAVLQRAQISPASPRIRPPGVRVVGKVHPDPSHGPPR